MKNEGVTYKGSKYEERERVKSKTMSGDKGKRILIHLSSSSSDSSSSASEDEYESIDDEDEDYDDDVYQVDDSDEDEEDDDLFDNGGKRIGDDDDEDALYNRVIQYLQENSDLRELSLKACKAYLRRHELRVSGSKDVCAKRVQEHWRIKDMEVEALYPRSSFMIDCTGDVCKGDIVLFTQKVYGSFNKMTRKGKLQGKRTVVGRVVKESYGAAKQQHTFTVEVLRSKGIKRLPPLFPLLVKGRNLYRLKTYRQPWKNEAGRRKVLDEKHKRGTIARSKRAKRKKAWSTDKGKYQKVSHSTRPSQLSYSKRGKCVNRDQRASSSKHSTTSFNIQGECGGTININAISKPFLRNKDITVPEHRVFPLLSSHDASQIYSEADVGSHHRSRRFGSTSAESQSATPYHNPSMMPVAQYNGFSCRPVFHNSHNIQLPLMTHGESWKFVPQKTMPGKWQNGLSSCTVEGCTDSGSDRCVIAACWRCCRREGMRCYIHR